MKFGLTDTGESILRSLGASGRYYDGKRGDYYVNAV